MMTLISKHEAASAGLTRYSTGKPCLRGHIAERMVSNRRCVECMREASHAWGKANRETCSKMRRDWVAANPERSKAIKAAWNKANPEGQARRSRAWYLANKDKADAATAKWRESNLDVAAAAQARRRARLRNQTPAWAQAPAILAFYREARRLTELTGIEHHVDHIVPLQSRLVSGLHVENNLQVLPGSVNRSKSNRLVEGYY